MLFRSSIYAETIRRVHALVPGCSVEVLIPDFKGDEAALATVLDAEPAILGHNLETVERLHPDVRPGGRYWRSVSYLGASKRIRSDILTKTGVILGMGEGDEEIRRTMADLRDAGVDILTSAKVHTLFVDKSRRVLGVAYERPDGSVEELGCGALVLACSGFGGNQAMVREHLPDIANALYFGHKIGRAHV